MRIRVPLLTQSLLGVVLLLAAACGDNAKVLADGPPSVEDGPALPLDGGDGGTGPECPTVSLERAGFQFDFFGQVTGLRYRVTPALGQAAPDYLLLELYDSTTPDLPPLATGTFDLSAAPDNDLTTCQHCLWLWPDFEQGGVPTTIFYASSGSLVLEAVEDPLSTVMAGHTTEVTLRSATIDSTTGAFAFVDGPCLTVPALAFDTHPTPGRACGSAGDCGNPMLEICDPKTATCAAPQCDEMNLCGTGEVCLSQLGDTTQGACYTECDPTNDACPTGEVCVQLAVDPTYGTCRRVGAGTLGESCTVEDITTSCVAGLTCEASSETCLPLCDYFAVVTGCTAGNACYVLGDCRPTTSGSAAAIGEPCGEGATLAAGCGADGQAFRGICFAFDPAPLVCERACLGDRGCGAGEFCALRFTSGLGICLPNPVCGDGLLGEIGETCDDGNTESGDGCSADCQTVEYDVLCAALAPLQLDATVSGTTLGGVDGFMSSCQFGIARGRLFSATLPGRGRLRLRLESATMQVLAARGACADGASELGCTDTFRPDGADLIVQVDSQHPGPLTVLVTAGTTIDEGPFTLTSEWVPELCGDGIVAGDEVCDDGNTTSGDGCSADCRVIEYGNLCAQAPLLSTTAPNTGTTVGGMEYFAGSCSNTIYGSGPDRIYRYVAPSAGTLQLALDQYDTNLVVAVFDDCGAPGTVPELGCTSAYISPNLSVALSSGQQVVVLVEGFAARDLGAYSLTATFTP